MTLFGGEPTAGTPTTPEDTAGEVSVRAVVEQAVRFMPSGLVIPGGMGQGEGPSPVVVDALVDALDALHALTAQREPMGTWLAEALDVQSPINVSTLAVGLSTALTRSLQPHGTDPLTAARIDEDANEADTARRAFATVSDGLPRERPRLTARLDPPEPANAPSRPPRKFGRGTFDDELSRRLALHRTLDAAYAGVLAPGDARHVRPSTRLYDGHWATEVDAWRRRYATACMLQLGFLPLRALVADAAATFFSKRAKVPRNPVGLFAFLLGRAVHHQISVRYLGAFAQDDIVADGIVMSPPQIPLPLSKLARAEGRRGRYGALNYSLAGGRCDLVNFSRHHLWEIKPAALAGEAVLQAWSYLDGYEVARTVARYEGEPAIDRLLPGPTKRSEKTLPQRVLEDFEIEFGPVTVTIHPFVTSVPDGLILYTVGRRRWRPTKRDAQAVAAVAHVKLDQVLRATGDVVAQRQRDAEAEMWHTITRCGLLAATVAATWVAATAASTLATEVTAEAGTAGVGAAGAAAGAEVAMETLIAARARQLILDAATRAAANDLAKDAAAAVTITIGERELRNVSPASGGVAIDSGVEIGNALMGRPQ